MYSTNCTIYLPCFRKPHLKITMASEANKMAEGTLTQVKRLPVAAELGGCLWQQLVACDYLTLRVACDCSLRLAIAWHLRLHAIVAGGLRLLDCEGCL